ncbi:MAG: ABC transporter ATP-binding protein [Spirochaetales bacterium]|nr:ABC transporter ATP-binding protein [Spirochaetales bacterium]
MKAFVEIRDLDFSYAPGEKLFESFSFKLSKGENWVILGPSGSGKSTLLLLMAGLRKPDKGIVKINSIELKRPRPETGLVLQDYGLLPWENLRQNIRLGFRLRGFYGPDGKHSPKGSSANKAEQDKRVDQWTHCLGMSDLLDRFPHQVSGGQRRRAALLRTLVMNPDLVLMDEPFGSLDFFMRNDLYALILKLHKQNAFTSVIVTHHIEEALILGRNILVLKQAVNREAVVFENPHYGQIDFYKVPGSEFKMCLEKQLKTRGKDEGV